MKRVYKYCENLILIDFILLDIFPMSVNEPHRVVVLRLNGVLLSRQADQKQSNKATTYRVGSVKLLQTLRKYRVFIIIHTAMDHKHAVRILTPLIRQAGLIAEDYHLFTGSETRIATENVPNQYTVKPDFSYMYDTLKKRNIHVDSQQWIIIDYKPETLCRYLLNSIYVPEFHPSGKEQSDVALLRLTDILDSLYSKIVKNKTLTTIAALQELGVGFVSTVLSEVAVTGK